MPAVVRPAIIQTAITVALIALSGAAATAFVDTGQETKPATKPATAPATVPATQPTTEPPPATKPDDAAPPIPPDAGMSHLQWMVGDWEGEGWVMVAPDQRETFTITENVEERLDGEVLLVEGYGTTSDEAGTTRPVHEALGVITFDPQDGGFSYRTFRKGSGQLDPVVEIQPEGGFDWTFEIEAGQRKAKTRYATRRLEDGRWRESGFISLDDGKTWAQFFEMTLSRVDDAEGAPSTTAATTQPAKP